MEVDDRRVIISNTDDCEYLAKKYQSMGYTVEWDRDLYKRKEEANLVSAEIHKINNMSRVEMCRLYRFATPSHPWFDRSKPFSEIFMKRFKELGGFSAEISKEIGWGEKSTCSKQQDS